MPDDQNNPAGEFDPATGGRTVEPADIPGCRPETKRKKEALAYRQSEAQRACIRDLEPVRNENNGEEWELRDPKTGVRTYAANYTKGMPHDEIGEVVPALSGPVISGPELGEGEALPTDEPTPEAGETGLDSSEPVLGEAPVADEARRFTAYDALLRAVNSEEPADFDRIPLGPNGRPRRPVRPYVDPQAGIAFDLEGPDAASAATYRASLTPEPLPVVPTFSSTRLAADMGELYLMALLRDVPLTEFRQGTRDPRVLDAVRLLGQFSEYLGPLDPTTGTITPGVLFRGGNILSERGSRAHQGELDGPPLSQFLVAGSRNGDSGTLPPQLSAQRSDSPAASGFGLRREDGFVLFGTLVIDLRQIEARPGLDHITDNDTWLSVLQGVEPREGNEFLPDRRFISTLRGLAQHVHFDQTYQEGLVACLNIISMNERLERKPELGPLFNVGNPYLFGNQIGFGTFGNGHVLAVLAEATTRAIKAAWYHKWYNHRWLRPEVLGGRINNVLRGKVEASRYNLNAEITGLPREVVGPGSELSVETAPGAEIMEWVRKHNAAQNRANGRPTAESWLLPQAYPEGSPLHPSYPAGHAAQIAAEGTVIKGIFNEDFPITDGFFGRIDPNDDYALEPNDDGTALRIYTGPGSDKPLTLGREINKLIANVALARSYASVHYRIDYTESALLGEYVGLGLLQEMARSFNNRSHFFQLTLLSGIKVRILSTGQIVRV